MVTISTSSFLQPFFCFSRGFSSGLIQPAVENGMGWFGGGERFKAQTKPLQPQRLLLLSRTVGALQLWGSWTERDAKTRRPSYMLFFSLSEHLIYSVR